MVSLERAVARGLDRRSLEGLGHAGMDEKSFGAGHAASEGLNSRIQSIKSAARGFRSFSNYRIRILFHFGKLDLKPAFTH